MIIHVIHDFSKQIKQRTRIGKIFARWHLVIAITTKKIDIIQCITHYTIIIVLALIINAKTIIIDFQS